MEFTGCEDDATAVAPAPAPSTDVSMGRSRPDSALQQAESAQSLAASSSCSCSTSASTSTCAEFSSGGECGGFEESPVMQAARLSLAFDIPGQGPRQVCSRGKACSSLSLALHSQPQQLMLRQQPPQQVQHHHQQQQQQSEQPQDAQQPQLPKLFPELGQGMRARQQQQQQARKRSNAISAKSMSSYLAQYKETKAVYFDGVLNGEIPVKRSPMMPRYK